MDWVSWKKEALAPLDPVPVGEYLRGSDEFFFLKSSFSGISDTDFYQVFNVASSCLSNRSKDLGIASYACCAATLNDGISGLNASLDVFIQLFKDFEEDIHPKSERARKNVHNWFFQQQERFIIGLNNDSNVTIEDLTFLLKLLQQYFELFSSKLSPDFGPLNAIEKWVKKKVAELSKSSAVKKVEPATQVQTTEPVAPTNSTLEDNSESESLFQAGNITSESNHLEAIRCVLSYNKEKRNYVKMVSISRAARWSGLMLPPNGNGKTRIPEPRPSVLHPMEKALQEERFEDAFLLGESLFMEGVMHFNFNLQQLLVQACKGLKQPALIWELNNHWMGLVERLPGLMELTYDSGVHFAGAEAKDYIKELQESRKTVPENKSDKFDEFAEMEAKAFEVLDAEGLLQALRFLGRMSVENEYYRCQQLIMQAKLLFRSKKYDIAKPLVEETLGYVERFSLHIWQPDLAITAWELAIRCYEMLDNPQDLHYAKIVQGLKEKIILHNPARAIERMS